MENKKEDLNPAFIIYKLYQFLGHDKKAEDLKTKEMARLIKVRGRNPAKRETF